MARSDSGKANSRTTKALVGALGRLFRPWLAIDSPQPLAALPDPAILAFNHNNTFECWAVPPVLMREMGRPVHFLVDWMYLRLPLAGWLIGRIDPIPVYTKPARWRLFESYRLSRRPRSPLAAALDRLRAGGSLGLFPEGHRNADVTALRRGRQGLGLLSLLAEAPVVPIGIEFPSGRRLGRPPRMGRLVLRVGDPLSFEEPRQALRRELGPRPEQARLERRHHRLAAALGDEVMQRLASLCGKACVERTSSLPGAESPLLVATPRRREEAMRRAEIQTVKVESTADRLAAMEVITDVYLQEKRWIRSVEAEISLGGAAQERTSWFLTRVDGKPAGVIRLTYDPPLEAPPELAFRFEPGVDLATLAADCRFADVGRFMIRPRYRRQIRVALSLMRAAVEEVVERGYSHLITDVFESDPHSPLAFHTRVLGFQRIGTHRYGELACYSLRVILLLDIKRSYARLRLRHEKVFRFLTAGLQERLEGLARVEPQPQAG